MRLRDDGPRDFVSATPLMRKTEASTLCPRELVASTVQERNRCSVIQDDVLACSRKGGRIIGRRKFSNSRRPHFSISFHVAHFPAEDDPTTSKSPHGIYSPPLASTQSTDGSWEHGTSQYPKDSYYEKTGALHVFLGLRQLQNCQLPCNVEMITRQQ